MKRAGPGRLELSTERRDTDAGAIEIVRAEGEVDLSNASDLAGALELPAGEAGVLLDLTGVPFMDSTGLGSLLVAARQLGSRLAVLVSPGSPLLRLFELAGVAGSVATFQSEDEALESIAAQPR